MTRGAAADHEAIQCAPVVVPVVVVTREAVGPAEVLALQRMHPAGVAHHLGVACDAQAFVICRKGLRARDPEKLHRLPANLFVH